MSALARLIDRYPLASHTLVLVAVILTWTTLGALVSLSLTVTGLLLATATWLISLGYGVIYGLAMLDIEASPQSFEDAERAASSEWTAGRGERT